MDLQYKVDFLEAQADGWKQSSLKRPENEPDQCKFSSNDVSDIFAASVKRHESLAADFAKLEEKCSRMEVDFRQRTSMHEAIVDGLESECKTLFHEIDDFQTDLQEKQVCIRTLEEDKERLENELDALIKDRDDAYRKASELQVLCNTLQQEKVAADTLTNSITSATRKLAYADSDGFPIDSNSVLSWTENLDAISKYIEHISKTSQDQKKKSILSPRSEEGRRPVTVDLVSQHYDILEDLKNTKYAIASAMSSPRLTPIKSSRRKEKECNDELYADLQKAHEQLESLSLKIQVFHDDQIKWKEWEAYYESRIAELEGENQIMKAATLSEGSQEVKMKEIGAVLIFIFQHRHRQSVMKRSFHTWVSLTRMSKHVVLVKDMAKELAMTRKKVLLLKSHLDYS